MTRGQDESELEGRLRERMKELECLFSVDRALRGADSDWPLAMSEVLRAIPKGFLYPDRVAARLRVDEEMHEGPGFRTTRWRLVEPVRAGRTEIGEVEVCLVIGPDSNSTDPFLPEERPLLRAVADRVGDAFRSRWAEEELRRREAYFRALAERSGAAIAVTDQEGVVRYASEEIRDILGLTAAALEGANLVELLSREGDDQVTETYHEVLDDPGEVRRIDVRWRRPEGEERFLDLALRNLLEVSPVEGIVFTLRDLTERKNLEDQLFRAQKMEAIGKLAGGLAHDFNNLFTVIRGYSEMMREDLPEDSSLLDDLDEILGEVQRASELIQQLLAFSREQILMERILDLGALVEEMEPALRKMLSERIELRIDTGDRPWWVRLDAARMRQVVANLATNAEEAIGGIGTVTLRFADRVLSEAEAEALPWQAQAGAYVELSMEDTGRGMPEDMLDRIFDPFFTTKPAGEGAGLGLSTAYGIVKQSGGHVLVESEPGRGSRFRILLPRVETPPDRSQID